MLAVRAGLQPLGSGRLAGRWLAPLCDMTAHPGGMDRCVYVHLCWPLAAGEVAQRTGGNYVVDCCVGGVFGFGYMFSCLVWSTTRTRLRALHGIPGDVAEDCVVTGLLPCCYLAQALNHLDLVDMAAGGAASASAPSTGASK